MKLVGVHRRLEWVLLVIFLLGAVISYAGHGSNATGVPVGLDVSSSAESTAIYCTGLSSGQFGWPGEIQIANTSGATRHITILVTTVSGTVEQQTQVLSAHALLLFSPTNGPSLLPTWSAQITVDGSGVVAQEIESAQPAVSSPCVNAPSANWYATGFSTLSHNTAYLSLYNPTGTPAVVNIQAWTSAGLVATAPFEGVVIAPQSMQVFNLGSQIIDASAVVLRVQALRGLVVATGTQITGTVAPTYSLIAGTTALVTSALVPQVATRDGAVAQLVVGNPLTVTAHVTIAVELGKYSIAPFVIDVAAGSVYVLNVVPDSRVPASDYATLEIRSSQPASLSLVSGSHSAAWIRSLDTPTKTLVLVDGLGHGYDGSAVLSNATASPAQVHFRVVSPHGVQHGEFVVAPHALRRVPVAPVDGMIVLSSSIPLSVTATSRTTTVPVGSIQFGAVPAS